MSFASRTSKNDYRLFEQPDYRKSGADPIQSFAGEMSKRYKENATKIRDARFQISSLARMTTGTSQEQRDASVERWWNKDARQGSTKAYESNKSVSGNVNNFSTPNVAPDRCAIISAIGNTKSQNEAAVLSRRAAEDNAKAFTPSSSTRVAGKKPLEWIQEWTNPPQYNLSKPDVEALASGTVAKRNLYKLYHEWATATLINSNPKLRTVALEDFDVPAPPPSTDKPLTGGLAKKDFIQHWDASLPDSYTWNQNQLMANAIAFIQTYGDSTVAQLSGNAKNKIQRAWDNWQKKATPPST